MTLPTRKQQIEAVAEFIDLDSNDERSLEEVAAEIVDGFHALLLKDLKAPDITIHHGMLIKTAVAGKVHRVLLIDDHTMWVIGETTGYGWLGPTDTNFWDGCEEYRPKRRVDGKMVEMTDEMIEEAWSNPGWSVGDQVSRHQREFLHEVIATGPKCVLLRNVRTGVLTADSNSNMEKYYKREPKGGSEW